MNSRIPLHLLFFVTGIAFFSTQASGQTVFSAAGSAAADIQASVDAFRAGLGGANNGVGGSFATGRREINWDGVPDAFAAPNLLPGNFFNTNSPRGVVMNTPGTGFQVSANSGVGPVQFENFNAAYPILFEPFSAQRLFTPIGSNITDVTFFLPGTNTPAGTTGFGSVFSDVDLANTTSLQFFDLANNSLGTFFVPNIAGDATFSFLGVSFAAPIVGRVRITAGNQILSTGTLSIDVVAMDDWIFGEPRTSAVATVPEGGATLSLLAAVMLALASIRRKAG